MILNYASSPNLQLSHMSLACHMEQLSHCNFSSHTLTSLNLISYPYPTRGPLLFPNSLLLPALTYLAINRFSFRSGDDGYANPFFAFKSLNTLVILYCEVFDKKNLSISSVSLINLSILPSIECPYKFELSTPNLRRFYFMGPPLQKLCGRNSNCNLSSVKHVKIDFPFWACVKSPSILFSWLHDLALMESFTICFKTLQILDLIPDSSKIDFPYLHNLKLLKIETHDLSLLQDGMGDFLLQNAPSAKKVIIHLPLPKSFADIRRKMRELYFSVPDNSNYM
ncbi:uncharacterized protein LOC131617417 [Vicia villosa]|uniref:uncharacterized protein LOC131617417 n=1 Tax=Vicia villosa TaxID=3911 RepID=UPI00273B8411|nr:uncharacterized protein LOC131617417 [Vicia villosa]